MKPGMKMMIANEARGNRGNGGGNSRSGSNGENRMEQGGNMRYEGGRSEMRGGSMGMTCGGDMRRDMGYEGMGYDMGGGMRGGYSRMEYGGMEAGGMDSPMEEMRRGRRRYKNGRFAPQSRYDPPEYGGEDEAARGGYDRQGESYPRQQGAEAHMNRIGFDGGMAEEGMIAFPEGHRKAGRKLDRETAEEWVQSMKNEDGTKGPHWTMEQTEQVRRQKNLDCDPLEFWVAMNAAYSDLSKVAKKYNANSLDYYVDYVKAFWFKDQDAVPNKLAAYYDFVVKK